jgi:hypothetical protein
MFPSFRPTVIAIGPNAPNLARAVSNSTTAEWLSASLDEFSAMRPLLRQLAFKADFVCVDAGDFPASKPAIILDAWSLLSVYGTLVVCNAPELPAALRDHCFFASPLLCASAPLRENSAVFLSSGHHGGILSPPFRRGAELLHVLDATRDTARKWNAAKAESVARRTQGETFHVRIDRDGRLQTHLSEFDRILMGVCAGWTSWLKDLQGRKPAELCLDRWTREMLSAIHENGDDSPRVSPAAREACGAAVRAYWDELSPLYRLPATQRIGSIDEADDLLCTVDFGPFRRGRRYFVETKLVERRRTTSRMDPQGSPIMAELVGSERVIVMRDDDGRPARFRRDPGDAHFSLDLLARHFDIPDTADIAARRGEDYARLLSRLDELEARSPGRKLRYRRFQREDLARAALADGAILAWEPGLGKTLGMLTVALLKLGWDGELEQKATKETKNEEKAPVPSAPAG